MEIIDFDQGVFSYVGCQTVVYKGKGGGDSFPGWGKGMRLTNTIETGRGNYDSLAL